MADRPLGPILAFIGGARETLDVAVQELESLPIAQGLVVAKERGVRVRVVLEYDYLTVDQAVADPWIPGGENQANRDIYQALLLAWDRGTGGVGPGTGRYGGDGRSTMTASRLPSWSTSVQEGVPDPGRSGARVNPNPFHEPAPVATMAESLSVV